MGQPVDPKKMPISWDDFPDIVVYAINIFNRLGDRVYPEIGYVGKDVESIISEPALYKKYKNKIEMQISTISMPWPALESVFLIVLAFYYLLLWLFIKKYYPEGQL